MKYEGPWLMQIKYEVRGTKYEVAKLDHEQFVKSNAEIVSP